MRRYSQTQDQDPSYRAMGAFVFPSDEPELESQHTAFDTKEYAQRLRNSTELRASMRLLVEQEGALERLIDSWVQTDAELPQDD